jgi:hypothetical protein
VQFAGEDCWRQTRRGGTTRGGCGGNGVLLPMRWQRGPAADAVRCKAHVPCGEERNLAQRKGLTAPNQLNSCIDGPILLLS